MSAPDIARRLREAADRNDQIAQFNGAETPCPLAIKLRDAAAALEAQQAEIERLRAALEVQEKGIRAVSALIADSAGVYGLHLNGDPAPWAELSSGGRFEDWLVDFDDAADALAGAGGAS